MQKVSNSDLKVLWKRTVEPLEARLGRNEFETWIQPMLPLAAGDNSVEIAVPNRMFAAWVQENFLEDLAAAWVAASGRPASFTFTWEKQPSQGELFGHPKQAPAATSATTSTPENDIRSSRRGKASGLVSRYDFGSFVVGPNNQFARAAAYAVGSQPGTLYNPFFVFGGVGLGKTHLVNAVGNTIVERHPNARVLFLSADTFTNQLIDAIARNKAPEFKNRMRRVDCLILDDVQFLAGRERTQEEFFHIFNALYENGRQIVLASDKYPHEIQGVEERLCNRFGWGLVADIQVPDEETRVAILGRKARDEGVNLPMNVASFIAARFDTNIRDLEGALTRLSAWASLNRCEITIELAEKLIGTTPTDTAPQATLEAIDARIVTHFGLKPGALQERKRTRKVAEARQIAMYIMRHHTGASFPVIGAYLGGRDHSTVVHGCNSVERRCKNEQRFRNMIDTLVRIIGCG